MLFYEELTKRYYEVDEDEDLNKRFEERMKRDLKESHHLTLRECYEMAVGETMEETRDKEIERLLELADKKPELFKEGSELEKHLRFLLISKSLESKYLE